MTSRDVAREAGVSQSLVSLILNQVPDKKIKLETRQHVLETAKAMGYHINMNARNMKNSRAGAIGLLSSWETGSFVFPPVISGVQASSMEKEAAVIVCTGKKDQNGIEDYVNYYLQNRIDGLIYVSYVGVAGDGVIHTLESYDIPFVCVIGARDIPGASCVDVNFLESGQIAFEHLVNRHFDRIAYIIDQDFEQMNYGEKERLLGCRKAAAERGITLLENPVFRHASCEEDFLREAETFLKSGCADAVISTSYRCYILLKAAARLNIAVPEALGVISLDNELFAPYLYPSLTTVDEPLYDIARSACRILFDKLQGSRSCVKLELPPSLTERESTGKQLKAEKQE